jgi:hypothetical protein
MESDMTQANGHDMQTAHAARLETHAYEGLEGIQRVTDGRPSSASRTAARTEDADRAPAHPLRRLAGRLRAFLADDGVGARFDAERGRDEGLVSRVASRRRH